MSHRNIEEQLPEDLAAGPPAAAGAHPPQGEIPPPVEVVAPQGGGRLLAMADVYFRPKKFESKALYEHLGVRFYKKYLPSSGDLMMRHVWKRSFLDEYPGDRLTKLKNYEKSTRYLESAHLGFFAMIEAVDNAAYHRPGSAAVHVGLQMGINVYPIMLQRYNRIRTLRLISRMSGRTDT